MEVFKEAKRRGCLRLSRRCGKPSLTKKLNMWQNSVAAATEVHCNLVNARQVKHNKRRG